MTEQLNQYRVAPDKNETVERLSPERQAQAFFRTAIADGKKLSQVHFDDANEAHEMGSCFVDEQIELAKDVSGLDELTLRAAGPGVRVANIEASSDDHGRIMIDFNADRPLLEPEVSSDVYGRFAGVVVLPREHDDNTHSSIPYFILHNQQTSTIPVNTQYGFPLAALTIQSRVLVACDGTATIELPALEVYQSRKDALAKMALQHHDKADLLRAINRLGEAMRSETKEAFTTLNKVEHLRMIGQILAREVEKGDDRSESIATAVREVLGRGRAISTTYHIGDDDMAKFQAQGVLIDILPENPYVPIGPALVLGCPDGKGGEEPHYIPLEHIETFQF